MKCERCDKNAKYIVTFFNNEEKIQLNLCEECYQNYIITKDFLKDYGLTANGENRIYIEMIEEINIEPETPLDKQILDSLIKNFTDHLKEVKQNENKNVCPNCKQPFNQILSHNMGCENCYEIYKNIADDMIERKKYSGKEPRWFKNEQKFLEKKISLYVKFKDALRNGDYKKCKQIKKEMKKYELEVKNL